MIYIIIILCFQHQGKTQALHIDILPTRWRAFKLFYKYVKIEYKTI